MLYFLNWKRFHGKRRAAELLTKAARAMTHFEPIKCSWDTVWARVLLYNTCAWLEDSASPFQPTFSTKPSETWTHRAPCWCLNNFIHCAKNVLWQQKTPSELTVSFLQIARICFATMTTGWTDLVKLWVSTRDHNFWRIRFSLEFSKVNNFGNACGYLFKQTHLLHPSISRCILLKHKSNNLEGRNRGQSCHLHKTLHLGCEKSHTISV